MSIIAPLPPSGISINFNLNLTLSGSCNQALAVMMEGLKLGGRRDPPVSIMLAAAHCHSCR